jgi:nucleotide-binding universal stress UspA family protein
VSRRSLVVGVDGSTGSDAAVRWAAGEAAARGLLLRIVHAAAGSATGPPVLGAAGPVAPHWERSAVRTTEDAAALARRHQPAVPIETSLLAGEQPATVLARAGDTAEMIVLGATGRGAVGRAVLGSTAVNVVRSVRRPAVVVRELASDVEPGPAGGHVVVGVDDSGLADAAVAFAFVEAALRRAPLTAVHAWTTPPFTGMRSLEASYEVDWSLFRERAAATLPGLLAGPRRDHPSVAVTEVVAEDMPAGALIDASRGANLLVVGSRGRSALAGLALGSVSTTVLHRAHCPVAVVRPT